MKGILGLILIIISAISFVISENRDNDFFWCDRPYRVVERHESQHTYKGHAVPEYYLTVKYNDQPTTLTCFGVYGSEYFLQKEGTTHVSRINNFEWPAYVELVLVIIGCVLLSIYMANLTFNNPPYA